MNQNSLFNYFAAAIEVLKSHGRLRTAEAYSSTLRSMKRYLNEEDIPINLLDTAIIDGYQSWLISTGLSRNSTSFYLRVLRALCGKAHREGIIKERPSFKGVYTGNDRTVKRALSLAQIRKIRDVDLVPGSSADFARDMFMMSFYMRGISFIDMALLLKSDLRGGRITYRRHKTGQLLTVKWTVQMKRIADRHCTFSKFLLPISAGISSENDRKRYLNISSSVNYHLKRIGIMLGFECPLTMYVARHSWATIAKSKNIPVSVISECMGHDSEMTTRIYLASLNNSVIDRANSIIIRSL